MMKHAFGLLVAGALLYGCQTDGSAGPTTTSQGREVPRNTPQVLAAVGDVKSTVLILYSHGANSDNRPEECDIPPFRIPGSLMTLNGKEAGGQRIAVVKYCYATKQGTFDGRTGAGEPRAEVRNRELRAVLTDLEKAGLSRERIILAGHSMGGWNSLLYVAENPGSVAGVIAFSPATAGEYARRSPHNQRYWDDHLRRIRAAQELPALVYWVEGDPNMRSSSQFDFLRSKAGTDFRLLPSGAAIEGKPCTRNDPHTTVFYSCFSDTQSEHLLDFVRARVR